MNLELLNSKRNAWLTAEGTMQQVIEQLAKTAYSSKYYELELEARRLSELRKSSQDSYFAALSEWNALGN
ncbi:hypothetical protein MCEMRE182_00028 [Candidatus Nanopelagicaceae bacterium]